MSQVLEPLNRPLAIVMPSLTIIAILLFASEAKQDAILKRIAAS